MCRMWTPLLVTAIKTTFLFSPVISASFGVHFSYDLFDSGRRRALLREREAQLSQAKENLARVTDEVELAVQTAYNKLERTQQMRKVSEELLALRTESNRVLHEQLVRGEALNSQADMGTAQELDAQDVASAVTAGLHPGERRDHPRYRPDT